MIRSIAGSIGPVLQVDKNTNSLTRSQAARVNVQLDISKQLPARVWVGIGANGFWQPVGYPDPPCSAFRAKDLVTSSPNVDGTHQQTSRPWVRRHVKVKLQPTSLRFCECSCYKEDESLRRWKEQLLGSVDLESVGEKFREIYNFAFEWAKEKVSYQKYTRNKHSILIQQHARCLKKHQFD
ncbi:hypothetical protein Taro_024748 [Colocasia esculenta]|uniref:Uncharacterized protein n=1 Tax=Colocasia esculenta TaxID=4460 RepID=A0A843V753_COLES|nr:hypothetical protein [Colocasia esculenta]